MKYPSDLRVDVPAFTRQPEGDGVIIGHPPRAAFILLPREAVEVLDDLASGLTVGEAQARHVSRYGEAPDMEDFRVDSTNAASFGRGPKTATVASTCHPTLRATSISSGFRPKWPADYAGAQRSWPSRRSWARLWEP